MTVTFIKLVYGVSCTEVNIKDISDDEGDLINYLDRSGLSEDDYDRSQVYHIQTEYLNHRGKQLIKDFEKEYDISHCVSAKFTHSKIDDISMWDWVEDSVLVELREQDVPIEKFKWMYVIEQW